jgi:hypothetical protein
MFKDVRTLKLLDLWENTAAYTRAVEPLYDRAEREALAAIAARYRPGQMDEDEALLLTNQISNIMNRFEADWALRTAPIYQSTGRIGRDAAADFTGLPVLEDVDERSQQYGERAMQFAAEPGGLLSDLRASLMLVVSSLTTRSIRLPPEDLNEEASPDEALSATSRAFASQRHRVKNWSGRLVELANQTLTAGMVEGSADAATGASVEWMAQWVHVGDNRMCETCTVLGNQGFVPLASLPTTPGGDTECKARCRCVLALWTRQEVEDGTAVLL